MKTYLFGGLLPMLAALAATSLWDSIRPSVAGNSTAAPETGATTGGPTSWVTVQDPREQAFSISVPKGWKTYGGLFRFSAVDTRLVVDMTSPDGNTDVRVGDATVPPYLVPGRFVRPIQRLAAYASGSVFATKYGQARFGSMCQQLQVTRSQAIAPKYHPPGNGLIRTTAGEATFTCVKNGAAMTAYVYSETTLIGPGGPGSNWSVVALGSMIAPSGEARAAATILQHSGESLVINPTWTRMQAQLNAQATRQIDASTQATIAATAAESARERTMISTLQNDSFNDVINGVSLKVDPTTGKRYEAPLGTGNPQWVNGNNVIVESALSPGPGFTQLQTVNH